jgi:phosphoglycerate dehydrogenase-like enzyme
VIAKRVGIAVNHLTRERYFGPESVHRLEQGAEVVWLEFDGPARATEEKPGDRQKLADFVVDLDALVVSHGCPRVTADIIAAAPRLKFIGDTHGDRFAERIDVAAARQAGVAVVDTTNGSSDPVAEWALALAMIGLRNAGALFRCSVLVSDPHAPALLGEMYDVNLTSLDNVMSHSDVVICLAPLIAETRGLIGRGEVEAMRPATVFVNVSRGMVVQTEALVERLERGDIIACLDVFDPEPIPVDHVVRRLPNVFLSPHIAGVTAASEPRFFDYMVDEVLRAFAGHRPRHELIPREPR